MVQDENRYGSGGRNKSLSDGEQGITDRLHRENNPLPEDVSEYVQKVRDELKQYEEQKKYFEKRRKKEIILELVDLLEKHKYPKEWLRLIMAQELGDYISTSYIEKILAEKYPNEEEKKVGEESTRQLPEIPRNDDKIPIEVSTTGESIGDVDKDDYGNVNPCSYHITNKMSEVQTKSESELNQQIEECKEEIVRALQKQVDDLQARCYQLNQLAQEKPMWQNKYKQLQQEFDTYRKKTIKGTAQIEFGSEFIPVNIEYSFKTNQFSAKIRQEIIERILEALRRG
jgi:hypothetical protein